MSGGLEAFQKALRDYTRYNRRELGPLIENRARRVQWDLYRRFREIAPTPEKINKEAEARGFEIRRRIGKDGKHLSVKQELALRRRSTGWLSISFLLRTWRAQREGQTGVFSALSRTRREVGKAIIRTAKGQRRPSVRIVSLLEGAAIQARQRGIVNRVLQSQTADMRSYIARKQQERIQKTIAKSFTHIIGR